MAPEFRSTICPRFSCPSTPPNPKAPAWALPSSKSGPAARRQHRGPQPPGRRRRVSPVVTFAAGAFTLSIPLRRPPASKLVDALRIPAALRREALCSCVRSLRIALAVMVLPAARLGPGTRFAGQQQSAPSQSAAARFRPADQERCRPTAPGANRPRPAGLAGRSGPQGARTEERIRQGCQGLHQRQYPDLRRHFLGRRSLCVRRTGAAARRSCRCRQRRKDLARQIRQAAPQARPG